MKTTQPLPSPAVVTAFENLKTAADRVAFIRDFAKDAISIAYPVALDQSKAERERIRENWRIVVSICDSILPPDYRGPVSLWTAIPSSALFDSLPLAALAFGNAPLDASWGDNAASLVWGDLVYTALHNCLEIEADNPEAVTQIKVAMQRLDNLPPSVFVDLES